MVPVGPPPGGTLATTDGPRPGPTPRSPWYRRTVVAVILASVVAVTAVAFGLLGGLGRRRRHVAGRGGEGRAVQCGRRLGRRPAVPPSPCR